MYVLAQLDPADGDLEQIQQVLWHVSSIQTLTNDSA